MSSRPPWSWPGAVALVLGGSLGLGWAGMAIISAVVPVPISEGGLSMIATIGSTIAGAVSAYLGAQIERRANPRTEDTEHEERRSQ